MPQATFVAPLPDQVLIGESFTFKVQFRNVGQTPGYGPFVDIAMDSSGADGAVTAAVRRPLLPDGGARERERRRAGT